MTLSHHSAYGFLPLPFSLLFLFATILVDLSSRHTLKMCSAHEKDRAHTVSTMENDAMSMATISQESSNSNDNNDHPGTLTAEEREEIHHINAT